MESSQAGPSGLQPAVTPGRQGRFFKKQKKKDMKIIQNAENDARLEELMTEDFTEKEAQIYRNRRANVNILLELAKQRRDLQLKKLEEKVAATNRCLQMSRDSLEGSSAERIKHIEDTYHLDKYHLEQQMAVIEQEQ